MSTVMAYHETLPIWVPVIVALITTIPATVVAWLASHHAKGAKEQATEANREATEANRAVNSRPPDEPTIYELVKDTHVVACKTDRKLQSHLAWHQREAQRKE